MNSVVIVGIATTEDYTRAIMSYTFPDELQIIVPKDTNNPFLTKALEMLHLSCDIKDGAELLKVNPCLIIVFTSFINVGEVSLLTDANTAGTDIVFARSSLIEI